MSIKPKLKIILSKYKFGCGLVDASGKVYPPLQYDYFRMVMAKSGMLSGTPKVRHFC
jgi:hypothetical protein